MGGIRLDHLVVAAKDLDKGRAWMEKQLGVPSPGGGRHAMMGTVNALWGLGDCYLEVIAIDPKGKRPDRPRWFGLDDPAVRKRLEKGPCLVNWAVAVDDLEGLSPPVPCDPPADFARDDLTWQVVLAQGAALPLGGAWPLTIRWTGGRHPARRLPDQGLRLARLDVAGRGARETRAALGEVAGPVRFSESEGPTRLSAAIRTPAGEVML